MQMRIKRTLGIIIGICLLFEGCGADHENTDASRQLAQMVEKQSETLEGYGTFLAEYVSQGTESGSEQVPGFALIYLDDDDIPELIVIEGNAHMCGASLYTFEKGETIPVGTYGQYGTLYYREKAGIVFDSYDSFGNIYDSVYQIEGTKKTLLQSFSEVWEVPAGREEEICTYTVDGKAVSEEQYSEVYENWYEDGYSEIDYGMCRILTSGSIQEDLTEEFENKILFEYSKTMDVML